MKTYDEMAQSALRRIDEHNKIKAKREKMIIKTVTPVICVCIVAVLSIGLYKGRSVPAPVIDTTNNTQAVTQAPPEEVTQAAKEAAEIVTEIKKDIPASEKSVPTAPNSSDEAYKKFINREGSVSNGIPALNITVNTKSISGDEALKNPDIAKYLPKAENVQIKAVHYDKNAQIMFVNGYVTPFENYSVRFTLELTPKGKFQINGFNLNTFSEKNSNWDFIFDENSSVFDDGYLFYCYNDTIQYMISVEDTKKETLLTLVDSLK